MFELQSMRSMTYRKFHASNHVSANSLNADRPKRARINMFHWQLRLAICGICICSFAVSGCTNVTSNPELEKKIDERKAAAGKKPGKSSPKSAINETREKPKYEAIALDGGTQKTEVSQATVSTEKEQMESVVAAMQPLQIMLGKWRGTTNREFKGSKMLDEQEWIWDFKTDRAQPALVVTSKKSPYIREARLTYLPAKQLFQFTATTPEGKQHVMTGKFEREPEEVTGDDNKPQKTYQLVVTETDPPEADVWQVAFDQQENNRYLLKMLRKRGDSFRLVDTVGTQRQGTSVAANDEDYGERKCIISGGLGTMTVSYNGNNYWVCCTGCQAAFNDDPKRWLAKMAEADKAKKP
jgi:hypothetical protein